MTKQTAIKAAAKDNPRAQIARHLTKAGMARRHPESFKDHKTTCYWHIHQGSRLLSICKLPKLP